jgi:trimeric autotransporter adhesin
MKHVCVVMLSTMLLLCSLFSEAQQSVTTTTDAIVPPLVNFSGAITDVNGKPITAIVGVTFSLYNEQQDGAPLWLETQNVKPNSTGHYTVMLGSTKSQGIPANIFASGEAHWLGVQVQGQAEQPRVLLVSAPYALKALDAETLGGQPASAFMPASGNVASGNSSTANTITGTGKKDYVPLWLSTTKLGSSKLFQSAAGDLGIGTTTPAANLDVNGTGDIRNTLTLFPNGSAPTLSIQGTAFAVSNTGLVTFVSGQTFPGAGTVTSIGSGLGLTGGPITGSGTLSIDTTVVPQLKTANTFTGNQTVNGNLTATNVTATQTVSGGVVNATTSFDIGGLPFAFGSYGNQNAFLGFAGNSTTTGTYNTASGVAALSVNTTGLSNTATGASALLSNTTGTFNTASGVAALRSNTTGDGNTASGFQALYSNTTANGNTASGNQALFLNTTGASNTASGYEALSSNTTGGSNTASGAAALYSNTTGVSNTASGFQALYSNTTANGNTASGNQALYSNTTGASNTADGGGALHSNSTGFNNVADGLQALYSNTTGYENTAVGGAALYSNTTGNDLTCIGYDCTAEADGLSNATAIGAHAVVGASNSLVLGGTGAYAVKVGIGTATPSSVLTIAQGAGHPVSDGWETFSSRRWKTNIQTLHGALGKVEQLRGVSYDLKANGKHEVGVIAEEVGAVVPELVSYEENGKDARSVDYSRLTALLIEATKEQQREFRQQGAKLAKALRHIQSLETEVREDRETLRKVKAQVAAAQPALVAVK